MDIINGTPFALLPFRSLDADGESIFTLVVRGTFQVIEGEPLRPLPDQEPLIVADTYYEGVSDSSLHWPNDLAPLKPNTDIHMIGKARSLDGKPLKSWDVEVSVGDFNAKLKVQGPSQWFYDEVNGWILSDIAPCTEVPLRYELASGGAWGDAEKGGHSDTNPIGRGCCNLKDLDKGDTFLAPQILGIGESIPALGSTHPTKGFAPIPPSWIQRRRYAGTYDDEWEENQHPLPPRDFEFDFYQAAHPDLVHPGYLAGDEKVELDGFLSGGKLSFSLPEYELHAMFTDKGDYPSGGLVELDTLQVDVDAMKAYLVWRVTIPLLGDPIVNIHLKMTEKAKLRKNQKEIIGG